MGLDMYLNKAKRIGKVTVHELLALDNYFSYITRPNEYRDSTPESWCGLDMKDVNLDLTENYITEYVHRYSTWDTEKKYGYKTIFEQIGYWRKANHIHKWFVDNIQDGVDECDTYEVTKEQLEDLLSVCKKVLDNSKLVKGKIVNGQKYENGKMVNIYQDGEYIEDSSVAKELLPTTSGFFFGGTDYDEWYYRDIENTVNIIENVLRTTDFEHEIVMYCSSW